MTKQELAEQLRQRLTEPRGRHGGIEREAQVSLIKN